MCSDGKKMSKRLKNYPDPLEVIDETGADALRLYLIKSPVVKGENLKFKLAEVREVVKTVLLPWYNAFRFGTQNYRVLVQTSGRPFVADFNKKPDNFMDCWVLASLQSLIAFVRDEMAGAALQVLRWVPCADLGTGARSLPAGHSGAAAAGVHRPADKLVRAPQPAAHQGRARRGGGAGGAQHAVRGAVHAGQGHGAHRGWGGWGQGAEDENTCGRARL
jgi:hypothetical protein